MATKRNTVKTILSLDNAQFRRGLARAQRDLGQFRNQANAALRGTAVAAGIAAAAVVKIGVGFEQSMANISAVTGKTGRDLADMEKKARSLGKATSFSASQAADAMLVLAKSGLKTKEVIAATESVLKFAGASMVDMGEAAEFTIGTMKSFSIAADDSARVVNALFAVTTKTNASFDDLKEAMKLAAPVASTFGFSIEETAAALGILAQQNLKGTLAATAFNEGLLQLRTPSEAAKKYLGDVSLQTADLATVIETLTARGFDAADAFEVFGKRGGRSISVWMNQGADALREVEAGITGTNAAWEAYETQQATTIGAFKRFLSALEEVAISISQTFGTKLRDTFDAMAKFVVASLGQVVDAVEDLKIKLSVFASAFAGVGKAARDNSQALVSFGESAITTAAAFYVLAVAVGALNAVMRINPWIALASAVTFFTARAIQPAVRATGGWVGVWTDFVLRWRLGWAQVVKSFKTVAIRIDDFGYRLSFIPVWVGQILARVRTLFRDGIDGISSMWSEFWKFLTRKQGLDEMGAGVSAAWKKMAEDMQATIDETSLVVWAPFVERNAEALATIDADFRASQGATVKWYLEQLAKLSEAAKGAAGPSLPDLSFGVNVSDINAQDPFGPLNQSVDIGTTAITEKMKTFQNGLAEIAETGWQTILDKDMTGQARREAIWASATSQITGYIGEQLKALIKSESVGRALTIASEKGKTIAKAQGASTRAAIGGAEVVQAGVETSANITQGASGFFAAFSKIPFIGVALALGAIAAMLAAMNRLPSFAMGGLVGGKSGTDANVVRATKGEHIMPPAQTSEFFPLLEGIRSGGVPSMRALASGVGGGNRYELSIPSGSLLVVDDEASLDRVATRLFDAMETGIKTRFRENG